MARTGVQEAVQVGNRNSREGGLGTRLRSQDRREQVSGNRNVCLVCLFETESQDVAHTGLKFT